MRILDFRRRVTGHAFHRRHSRDKRTSTDYEDRVSLRCIDISTGLGFIDRDATTGQVNIE